MLLQRLTLDLYFNRQVTLTELKGFISTSYRVIDANDDYITIEHPTDIGIEYNMEIYNQWYVNFIDKNYSALKNNGLDRINIFINVFYSGQCNFEIFDSQSMSILSKYNVSLPISVFHLSNNELKEILSDNGYSKNRICEIFKSE
ncbi:hypothetical protein F9959_03775 [Bacteroides stercoris]|uniref:Uncharacterized protein n=1 Tax=Bacteroides stercoris TaxID=46506 RepID=A0A6A2J8T1_BACSE|nr:hypothetical protein [Bacteroides stercoris]KAB5264412.1 hypothetical protein F9968_04340 [Bacteroides stercoris]KAB5264536.1 hypothetical protein F9966_03720 [Bacteroides stercoris]KAB5268392.1 hypothetical protein F9952_06145 [Bacteroides stercoris]KAB5282232.1 hypothetical protein F9962_07085 [Bacteroides stercoris]KAB5286167.1 hypothetical protein F9957_04355 [Bacteroides stercoris]